MIALAAAILAWPAQTDLTYEIGGEKIQVQLPTWKGPEAGPDVVEVDGWKYGFRDGKLIDKADKGWGWDDLGRTVTTTQVTNWPLLINVVGQLNLASDIGYLTQREGDIYTDDLKPLKRETAIFCYLVQQYTGGKVAIRPTWRVAEQMVLADSKPFLWQSLAAPYLAPYVNATTDKPAEGLGPFASSLLLEPSFSRSISLTSLDKRPIASVPVYSYFDRARPGQLARAMFNAWVASLAVAAQPDGPAGIEDIPEPMGDGPLPLLHPDDIAHGNYAVLADPSLPRSDTQLSTLTTSDLAAKLGGDSLARSGAGSWSVSAGGQGSGVARDQGQAGILFAKGEKSFLAVRLPFADLFTKKLGKSPIGQAKLNGSAFVIFEGAGVKNSVRDDETLGLSPAPQTPVPGDTLVKFDPGQAEKLPIAGGFEAKTVADPDRGSVGEIREVAVRRKGWVRLLGPFDGSKQPFLEFWIKPRGRTWPLNIVVQGDGWAGGVFRLSGPLTGMPDSPPLYSEDGAVDLTLSQDPAWQKVIVDLRLLQPGASLPIKGVYLSVPANAGAATAPRTGAPAILLDDFGVVEQASGSLTPTSPAPSSGTPAVDATDPRLRAAFAHKTDDQAALLKLLGDADTTVQWNAADRFMRLKNPASIAGLALIGRHFNPRLAWTGSLALAQQGSDTAIDALRYNFQRGLGDFVKQYSAQAMPAINDRKILAELAVGLNARRPEARAEVVRALARQPFKEASLVMGTFLNDLDPLVRLAVVQSLPQKDETMIKRLLGEAQNDPSDEVRAAAFKKLKEWGAPEASEAAKDPSPRVRAAIG